MTSEPPRCDRVGSARARNAGGSGCFSTPSPFWFPGVQIQTSFSSFDSLAPAHSPLALGGLTIYPAAPAAPCS